VPGAVGGGGAGVTFGGWLGLLALVADGAGSEAELFAGCLLQPPRITAPTKPIQANVRMDCRVFRKFGIVLLIPHFHKDISAQHIPQINTLQG
jgi:hypothetical protein